MKEVLAFINGKVITPFQLISPGMVIVEGDFIKAVGCRLPIPENARIVDVKGAYISPGFIDLHLHGAWGGDVMAAEEAQLERMAEGLARGGVTSFLPTTLSGPLAEIQRAVDCISRVMARGTRGARILGVHLEGPYFNQAQRGAQNPEYIIEPRPEDYLPLLERYPCIVRVSAAPEIPGGLALGRELRRRGIVASIAHSDATYQDVLRAVENGYTHVTHIFSGMSTVRRVDGYRLAGVVESTLLLDELTTEIIADGHHLPPSLMRLVLKTKGLDRVCLVTDSMSAAGLGPGTYRLGGLDVIVEADVPAEFEVQDAGTNFVAKLADRSAFASSVATMNQLVRNMVKLVGLTVPEAVRLATVNPARFQKLDRFYGVLAEGMKADLTVFDEEIEILLTVVDGRIVYEREKNE